MKKMIFIYLLLLFGGINFQTQAQNTPSVIEWNYTSQSTIAGFENDDNWIHSIIQASDGNFIGVGFSDKGSGTSGERHPAILKYNPGRSIVWEKITSNAVGIPIANCGVGGFTDVAEVTEGGQKVLYVCGTIARPASSGFCSEAKRIPVLAKYYLNTGDLIYYKQYSSDPNSTYNVFVNSNFQGGTFFRLAPVASGGITTALYLCGSSAFTGVVSGGGTVYKINPSTGGLDVSFNATGFRQYNDLVDATRETKFRDITSDGSGGFVLAGSVRTGTFQNAPQRDALVIRIQSTGAEIWRKIITESNLSGYVDLNQATETPFCTGSPSPATTETGNEEAWSVERMPNGDFAVLARFDWIELGTGGMPPPAPSQPNINGCWQPTQLSGTDGCWPFNTEQYYDNDLALIKLRFSDGLPLYSLDAGRSEAVDNWAHMVISYTTIYLLASKFIPDNNNNIYNEEICGSVIKIEDQPSNNPPRFLSRWRKDSDPQYSFEFCPFGICLALDGGVVIGGNNACNGDDYEIIKWASDCQPNYSFAQAGLTVTNGQSPVWGTSRTVKGTIRIQAGGTLTINNGAVIQFANTYLNNDWYTLAQGSGTPTKIIVEVGGQLILDNCTLKGLNSCSREWMWEGIEVLGTPSQYPILTYQGKVEMKGNAKIINAYNGITAASRYYNSIGRSESAGLQGGGMVWSHHPNGSTVPHFQNCRFGAWFAPVTNLGTTSNTYRFENTNFVNDAPIVDVNYVDGVGNGYGPNFQLGSWNQDKISVSSCKFSSTGNYPETVRGHGIDNFDAKMTVTSTQFQQLYKGLHLRYSVGITDPLTMSACTLTQVRHGAHIIGGSFHSISGSTFQQIPTNLFNDNSYGVRFEGSTNLSVSTDNIFNSTNSGVYGIITTNSGANASEFFDNAFTGVDFGVQTEQNNAGLQLRCNSYSGNDFAWSINPASPGSGLFSNQGVCGIASNQAGNIFSLPDCPGGVPQSHIKSTVNFEYRSRSGSGYSADEVPTCVSSGVAVILCGLPGSNSQSCAPPCCPGCCLMESMMEEAVIETEMWEKQSLHNQVIATLLSNNSTEEAISLIKEAFPDDKNMYIGALINSGKYEEAQAELSELASSGASLSDFTALYQVLLDLAKNEKSIMEISPQQEAALLTVAEGESTAKYQAQNVLEFAKGMVFNHPIEQWQDNFGQSDERAKMNTATQNEEYRVQWLTVQPNPANGTTEVHWQIREDSGVAYLQLFNSNGTAVLQQTINAASGRMELDLHALPAGIYIVRINDMAQKLIIK